MFEGGVTQAVEFRCSGSLNSRSHEFAVPDMKVPREGQVFSIVYDLQSACGKLQSAIVDATFGTKADDRRA